MLLSSEGIISSLFLQLLQYAIKIKKRRNSYQDSWRISTRLTN